MPTSKQPIDHATRASEIGFQPKDVDSPIKYLSLYSGGGGLDLGFKRAVPNAECVAYVEREASAAALLCDHVEAGLLDAAPIHTDALTFPTAEFHGLVDWLIGGPPCQPFSVAGKRLAADDPRNLWPATLRMVAEVQPRGCFFENVPSAESLWYVYEEVIPGLRYLGYEVAAGIFSAAEVGAPHQRERLFILAHTGSSRSGQAGSHDEGRTAIAGRRESLRARREVGAAVTEPSGGELAHTGRGSNQRWGELGDVAGAEGTEHGEARQQRHGDGAGDSGAELGDSRHGPGRAEQRQQHEVAPAFPRQAGGTVGDADGRRRWQKSDECFATGRVDRAGNFFRWPPGPDADWSHIPERLWPATVEPGVRDLAHGLAVRLAGLPRVARLRIAGNGVVPATAERAFSVLWRELTP